MSNILSNHYLLVTDVIYHDVDNTERYNALLWWSVRHCNVSLKLRTVIKDGKPITIMTLVTPDDRKDLVNEFNELVNKVNGLYSVYDLIPICGGLTLKDDEEDKARYTQD